MLGEIRNLRNTILNSRSRKKISARSQAVRRIEREIQSFIVQGRSESPQNIVILFPSVDMNYHTRTFVYSIISVQSNSSFFSINGTSHTHIHADYTRLGFIAILFHGTISFSLNDHPSIHCRNLLLVFLVFLALLLLIV